MSQIPFMVLDLETTTDIEAANMTDKELLFQEEITFICACMYAPIQATKPEVQEFYGKDAAEQAVLNLPAGRYYTWNGSRFDMHYIYHLLRKAGYEKQGETNGNSSKKKQLKKYEMTYLLSGSSKIITLDFRNDNGVVEIRDACLLFTCSLKRFIENTCPELPKLVGTYDYRKYRVTEADFSESDKEYCRHDIYGFSVGMYRIRKEFQDEFGLDILDSLTAGSFAMKYAKTRLSNFKELFPEVNFDRNFVMGGRTYVNPIHQGKILEGVTKIDANSFYPTAMVRTKLPFGPMKRTVMNSAKLKQFLLANPDKYVFAHLKKGVVRYDDMFSPIVTRDEQLHTRDYPNVAGASENVYLDDNVLRDTKFKHTNCIFMCYIFDSKVGLLDYMAEVFELKNRYKKEGKPGLELAVKIILNSTYGKFIQRDWVEEYDFFDGLIEPTGQIRKLRAWYLYPPVGAAITANCRYILTTYMNMLGERFIYCDTDSLVFIGEPPPGIPLGLELGEWKVEAHPEGIQGKDGTRKNVTGKAVFFQRKTYAMEIDGVTHVTFCGISESAVEKRYPNGVTVEQLQEDMKEGIVFDVLQSRKTLNGIVLVERARSKKYTEAY